MLFQLPPREKYNCNSLRRFNVYTRLAEESSLQLVESSEVSTRTMLSDVDPYSNLTVGVSLVNSAGLESAVEQVVFVGSKCRNNKRHIVVVDMHADGCRIIPQYR